MQRGEKNNNSQRMHAALLFLPFNSCWCFSYTWLYRSMTKWLHGLARGLNALRSRNCFVLFKINNDSPQLFISLTPLLWAIVSFHHFLNLIKTKDLMSSNFRSLEVCCLSYWVPLVSLCCLLREEVSPRSIWSQGSKIILSLDLSVSSHTDYRSSLRLSLLWY